MLERTAASLADLYETQHEGKAELVRGELVLMSPASGRHGRMSLRIARSLQEHEERYGGGVAFPDNVGFAVDLPDRKSFSPDAAWLAGVNDDEIDMYFVEATPTFAVEIRSKDEYGPSAEAAIRQKIDDYFAAGTLVVWDIDLLGTDVVRSYHVEHPQQPVIFRRGDQATAEPAVIGWRFAVNALFKGGR